MLIGLATLGVVTAAHAFQANHGFDPSSLDADRDGVISPQELSTHGDQLFARADQDRNGQLSSQELRALHAMMPAANHASAANHGAEHGTPPLSQARFREMMGRHAAAADADRDGRLTVAEVSAAMQHGSRH
ncbi:MAG TPA: hypothetical protein VGB60_12195 [Brevundimonas sp.]|uniref:hypothetical protein n=1 Tax=Brevundimonas sp. TaxID=1871086 RepID=UPI002EDA1F92